MIDTLLLVAALAAPSPDSLRPAEEVRLGVLRRATEIRRCYENEGLARNARLSGTIQLSLTIRPNGEVRAAVVDTTLLTAAGVAEVAACITSTARNWRFERGPYSEEIHLFPLRLIPEDRTTGRSTPSSRSTDS